MAEAESSNAGAYAQVASSAFEAGGKAAAANANRSASRRSLKESKRAHLAKMYQDAIEREFGLAKHKRKKSSDNTSRRTAALQETSNDFTKALMGG